MRKVEETRSNHSPAAVPRKAIILDSPNKKKHQTTGTEFYCNFLHSLLKKIPVPIVVVTQNPAPRRSFGPPRIPSKEIEIEEFNGKILHIHVSLASPPRATTQPPFLLEIRTLVSCSGTWTSELLGLASSVVGNEQRTVVGNQLLLNLVL